MDSVFFDGWQGLTRSLIVGAIAYPVLIFSLRWSGKRTLSKMNAFDLIVTVALGSTLATVLLNKNVALFEGVAALILLIALQFLVTWTSVRVGWVRRVVTGEPQILLKQGKFLPSELRRARVTESEILAAIRSAGLSEVNSVEAVILETDGSFSVVNQSKGRGLSSLADVKTR